MCSQYSLFRERRILLHFLERRTEPDASNLFSKDTVNFHGRMSDEKSHNPLDKLHLRRPPWKKKDDDGSAASESSEKESLASKLHLPWKKKHDDDDGSKASNTEKEPLVSKPSTSAATPTSTTTPTPKKQEAPTDASSSFARVWEVKMPSAKKTMVHGVLMPTVTGTLGSKLIQRKRRIVIEIHSSEELGKDHVPSPELLRGDSFENVNKEEDISIHAGERVAIRILKPAEKGDDSSDEEDGDAQTVSTIGLHAADEEEKEWVTNYVFGLDDVEVLKTKGSHCELKLGHGSDTQVRHVNFNSEQDVKSFQQVLEKLVNLKHKLTEQRVREFAELSPDVEGGSRIKLLIEIVSGINLPATDEGNKTDAYVIVRLGSREVHRTLPINGT